MMSFVVSFRQLGGRRLLEYPQLNSATLLSNGYTIRLVWDRDADTGATLDPENFDVFGTINTLTGIDYSWYNSKTLDIEFDELVAEWETGITIDITAGGVIFPGNDNEIIEDFTVNNLSEIPWLTVPWSIDEISETELVTAAPHAELVRGPIINTFGARSLPGLGFMAAQDAGLTAAFKTDHSAEVVFKMNSYPTDGNVYRIFGITSIAQDSGASINNFLPGLQINSSGIIAIFWEQANGIDVTITSSTTAPLDQWIHVAWTATTNGGNFDIEIFLDGTSVYTGSGTLPTGGSATKLTIGTTVFGNNQRLDGSLFRALLRTGDQSGSFTTHAADPSIIESDINTVGFWDFGIPNQALWPARFTETELWFRGDTPGATPSTSVW